MDSTDLRRPRRLQSPPLRPRWQGLVSALHYSRKFLKKSLIADSASPNVYGRRAMVGRRQFRRLAFAFAREASLPLTKLLEDFTVLSLGLFARARDLCARLRLAKSRAGFRSWRNAMSRKLVVASAVLLSAIAGCRGPQCCTSPEIVNSSPIAGPACMAPAPAPACSSCAGGGGAGGAVVSPYGPPPTVGVGPIYGPSH
jgi:hypothetical protein